MEAHPTFLVAWGGILLLFLVTTVLLATTAAFVVLAFRKAVSPAIPLVLGIGLALFLLLGLVASFSVPLRQHAAEQQHRDAIQKELRAMGEALHNRHAEGLLPIEAPRSAASTESEPDSVVMTPDRPEWLTEQAASAPTGNTNDSRQVVVSGQQFADRATAESNALNAASKLVRDDFEKSRGLRGDAWILGDGVNYSVRDRFTEEILRTAGENQFTVYRTHLLVELSPQTRDMIEPIWRGQVSQGRSILVAGLLAAFTAAAGIFTTYFRLMDRTAGRYAWRLRFAAAAATLLAGGIIFAGTNLAEQQARRVQGSTSHSSAPCESPMPVSECPQPVEPAPAKKVVMQTLLTRSCQ